MLLLIWLMRASASAGVFTRKRYDCTRDGAGWGAAESDGVGRDGTERDVPGRDGRGQGGTPVSPTVHSPPPNGGSCLTRALRVPFLGGAAH